MMRNDWPYKKGKNIKESRKEIIWKNNNNGYNSTSEKRRKKMTQRFMQEVAEE